MSKAQENQIDFTGERYVPGIAGLEDLYAEHTSRYQLASHLCQGKRVLDVCCGCGYGTYLLASSGAKDALGIDISEEAITFARNHYRLPNLAYSMMDARKLGLKKCFDLVVCFEGIEHVDNPDALLGEIVSAVKEDGIVLISTPNSGGYFAGEDGKNPFHYREFSRDEFEKILKSHFDSVLILEQRWMESVAFICSSSDLRGESTKAERLLTSLYGNNFPPEPVAPYFIAICSKAKPLRGVDRLLPLLFYFTPIRYEKLREEFDRRGKWAKELETTIKERDATIRVLMEEKETLRQEFDERGKWALGLEEQLKQKDDLISELTNALKLVEKALADERRNSARLRERLVGLGRR